MRYRLRTLLGLVVALAVASGGVRIWYDRLIAEGVRQRTLAESLTPEMTLSFAYVGPRWPNLENLAGGRAYQRATSAWCEDAGDFAAVVGRLKEFPDLETLTVLGRQIMPHVAAADSSTPDAVITALRTHPSLKNLVVDASIRGAPLEPHAHLYTREDLARLEAALPELEIVWIEVN